MDIMVDRDSSVDSIGLAVVEAVATVTNARLESMPLLLDVVDLDALERLFNQSRTGVTAFQYCGCFVTVRADGQISIYETEDELTEMP